MKSEKYLFYHLRLQNLSVCDNSVKSNKYIKLASGAAPEPRHSRSGITRLNRQVNHLANNINRGSKYQIDLE